MKVLIADSNFISLNGLRAILSNEKNLMITGEARNEHELMDHIKLFSPDVVVIDYTADGFSIDSVPRVLR